MPPVVPIVDVATAKTAGWQQIDGATDDVIARCIDQATADIETRIFPRRIVSATYTLEPYDGDAAKGRWAHEMYLDQYPVTALTVVKENGLTLVTGTGYDAAGTRDVMLYADRGVLVRKSGTTGQVYSDQPSSRIQRAWACGLQNVEVTYTAGYADPLTECGDLAAVCIELALLHFKVARRVGNQETRRTTGGTSMVHELPESRLAVIDRYAGYGRPRCRLAA